MHRCQALPGPDDHILVTEGVLGLGVSHPLGVPAVHSTWEMRGQRSHLALSAP